MNKSAQTQITNILNIVRNLCENGKIYPINNNLPELYCELIFDGFMCWPETKAGQWVSQPCENEWITTKLNNTVATKFCQANGSWYKRDFDDNTYTNYSQCGDRFVKISMENFDHSNNAFYEMWIPIINDVCYLGYTVSLLSGLLAMIIFTTIKRLHCGRNKLHVHLFMSFIMRAAMCLIKGIFFVEGTTLVSETDYVNGVPVFANKSYSWICKAIISLQEYFMVSNYVFILMEGLYLHNLMFLNLFSHQHDVKFYCLLGWGLPFIVVMTWILLKIIYEDLLCWTKTNSNYISMVIQIPICTTVVINFLLFLIIIRVLFVKITSNYVQQRKQRYRKLLKATLILILFLGVPYSVSLVMSYYTEEGDTLEIVWLIFDQTFSAFQGLFAALVYCLLNTDVQAEIKRKYYSLKDRNNKEFRRSRTISHTLQYSLHHLDDINKINGTRKVSECTF